MALYEKHNYLDKNVSFLCSNEIYEYDMQSAGFNIIKHFKLLDDKTIEMLEKCHKKRRQIEIGLIMREDKTFGNRLNQGFKDARKLFFEANDIKDEEVLSIKKDAIFTLRACTNLEFGNIKFVCKNKYSSYYYLNNLELYYNKENLHVKGISDECILKHTDYMLDFLKYIFQMMEISDRKRIIKTLKEFARHYKNKDLEIGYYREFNNTSLYKSQYQLFDSYVYIDECGYDDIILIDYNYVNIIVPLCRILL